MFAEAFYNRQCVRRRSKSEKRKEWKPIPRMIFSTQNFIYRVIFSWEMFTRLFFPRKIMSKKVVFLYESNGKYVPGYFFPRKLFPREAVSWKLILKIFFFHGNHIFQEIFFLENMSQGNSFLAKNLHFPEPHFISISLP